MEKDEFLDTPHKERMISKLNNGTVPGSSSYSGTKIGGQLVPALCFLLLTVFLSSCSLPRIISLDDPLSPEEHLNLGVAYEKNGELDNAFQEYEKASKKSPLAYLYMGNIYFQKHNYKEAEVCYKKTIKQYPNGADAYNNLAWIYFLNNEKLDEAERLVLRAIELNPSQKENYSDTLRKIREIKHPD